MQRPARPALELVARERRRARLAAAAVGRRGGDGVGDGGGHAQLELRHLDALLAAVERALQLVEARAERARSASVCVASGSSDLSSGASAEGSTAASASTGEPAPSATTLSCCQSGRAAESAEAGARLANATCDVISSAYRASRVIVSGFDGAAATTSTGACVLSAKADSWMCAASALSAARTSSGGTPSSPAEAAAT